MSTPLTQQGYVVLHEVKIPTRGVQRILYKITTEELWLQRLDGSLKLLTGGGDYIGPTGPTGPTGPSGSNFDFYYQDSPPIGTGTDSITPGSIWYNTIDAYSYIYIFDGVSYLWVTVMPTV